MKPFSYKSTEWQTLRALALKRARFKCLNCGASVIGKGLARVDHIETVRERPDLAWSLENLRVLCVLCDAARHAEKGARKVERVAIGVDGFPTEA